MPVVADATALLSGQAWYPGPPAARGAVLTYSFSTAASPSIAAIAPQAAAGFQTFDPVARDTARQALAAWSAVAGITFIETTAHPGDITFGLYSTALLGAPSAAGFTFLPFPGADLDQGGAPRLDDDADPLGGEIVVDSIYRITARDDLIHVLLHEIGHAIGLKHTFSGDVTLDPALDNGLFTVMGYAALRMSQLGSLDAAAAQALYGPPGTPGPGSWSWDAATETLTQTVTAPSTYVRGTAATDMIAASGAGDVVVTMEGDDTVTAAGQRIAVDGGDGYDVVVAGLALRPDLQRSMGHEANALVLFDHGAVLQSFLGVERIDFLNGSYDTATEIFTPSAPLPTLPTLRHWWPYGSAGLGLAGNGQPGSTVTVRDSGAHQATAAVAADGTWSLELGRVTLDDDVSIRATLDGLDSATVAFATTRLGSAAPDALAAPDARPAALRGLGGDDTLTGGPGDDLLIGGSGTDTVVFAALRAEVRLGIAGVTAIARGPGGTDMLVTVERVQFADTGPLALSDLAAQADPLMAVTRDGHAGFLLPEPYAGPVAGLATQLLGSSGAEAMGGTLGADFINLLGGDDAVDGLSGDDVLDGGLGSNFLTGGAGTDVFFIDGRGGGLTWSTITDWGEHEQLSLWGWDPIRSTSRWAEQEGAPTWQGATLHVDLDGDGADNAIVTWAGKQPADLPAPLKFDGLLWFL